MAEIQLTEEQQTKANEAADDLEADIYLYNGPVSDAGFIKLVGAVSHSGNRNCVFILTTYGGDPNAAYRIARWLQNSYESVTVFPSGICASAGTLIATGSSVLVMSPLSELGPLDVQLLKNNDITGRKSGLVTHASLDELKSSTFDLFEYILLSIKARSGGNVDFETASKVASSLAGSVMASVYAQIDPDILGENHRNLRIAEEYGRRLAKSGKNMKPGGIRRLVHDYPSHDFVIDMDEATELFERVTYPPSSLVALFLSLEEIALKPRAEPCVGRLALFKDDDGESSEQEEDADHAQQGEEDGTGEEAPEA